jgi:transposase-like protein/transposase
VRAAPLGLREGDREKLMVWSRASTVPAGLVQRARIVLLAADGVSHAEVARRVGVNRQTVINWWARYETSGLVGLDNRPRSGRPRRIDRATIITATLTPPPSTLGVTHWSSRLLAARLGIDHATVARAWIEYGVQPWRCETVKVLHRPRVSRQGPRRRGAVFGPAAQRHCVVCGREVPDSGAGPDRTDAADATGATRSPHARLPPPRHHALFAALEIATGKVTATCQPRHRHQEFLTFLKQVARAYPHQDLHLVMDNYAAHKHPAVHDWLAAHPRIAVHFTPTHASWMNLVEVWFGIIERQAIHRGTFRSVRDLITKIRVFINGWNDRCHPFTWTKTADDILAKADRRTTSETRH